MRNIPEGMTSVNADQKPKPADPEAGVPLIETKTETEEKKEETEEKIEA